NSRNRLTPLSEAKPRIRRRTNTSRRSRADTLERTSITLKDADRAALQKLSMFFIERGYHRVQTSSLVQLALQVTAELLEDCEDTVIDTHEKIRSGDRRKSRGSV